MSDNNTEKLGKLSLADLNALQPLLENKISELKGFLNMINQETDRELIKTLLFTIRRYEKVKARAGTEINARLESLLGEGDDEPEGSPGPPELPI